MEKDKNKVDWMSGITVFSDISTWIVVPVVLAMIFGKKLDIYYNTKPWIFIIFIAFSFLISSYGIIKAVRKYKVKLDKENLWKNKQQQEDKKI